MGAGLFLFIYLAGFAQAQESEKNEKAKEFYIIGNSYYEQGKYKEALTEYQKAWDLLSDYDEMMLPGFYEKSRGADAGPERPLSGFQRQAPLARETELPRETRTEKTTVQEPASLEETGGTHLEYTISVDDILRISVWENPDLDQDVTVRPDGKISVPLVGDVQASGLSITQLDDLITRKYEDYIKSPVVSISIMKMGGSKIIILGQISTPGVYTVTGSKSILEVIAMAGGFTKDAVSSSTLLIRKRPDKPSIQRINLTRALDRGDLSQNVALQREDVIFVPKKFIADLNYFLDQILGPLSKGLYTAKELQGF